MGRVYAVTSGKGGVGKSTVSVGLATSLSRAGQNVLLVDMDEGLGCLDLILGVDESVVFNLADVLKGRYIEDAIYPVRRIDGLYLVPAPKDIGQIDNASFTEFVNKVRDLFDVVIFDFPAGIDFSLYTCLPKDALFLTVAVFDPVSIRDAAAVGERLNNISCKTRLIINKFDYSLCKKGVYCNIDELIDNSGLMLLGIVPITEELSLLSVRHILKPKHRAVKAFDRIAKRLNGEKIFLPRLKKI